LVKLVCIASIGGLLFGYDTGIVAGAQMYFHESFPEITDSQIELIVSLTGAGACVGSLLAGPVSDRVGRKSVILGADVLFATG
jgi:MFS family permease